MIYLIEKLSEWNMLTLFIALNLVGMPIFYFLFEYVFPPCAR